MKNCLAQIIPAFLAGISIGGTPKRLPRKRKNCCRKLVLSFRVYTLGEVAEIPEIFSKNGKKSIFYRDFYQNMSKFSWKFSKLPSFLVQMRKTLHSGFVLFLPYGNYSSKIDYLEFFYKCQSIFSKKVHLHQSHFWGFLKNVSTR